jgi:hypothetical protein
MSGPNQIEIDSPPAAMAVPMRSCIANLDQHWDELHRRGVKIAKIAALSREAFTGRIAEFPLAIRKQSPARQDIAINAVADLLAITEPGITALSAIEARGQDATAPALALWREYHAAREALMALAFDGITEG